MVTPVIILSGFLGSGKTTLLLSVLKECSARGLTPGILMNELGKRDVDGTILEEQAGVQVQKLLDGCVCCSRKSELPQGLSTLLQRSPDVIVIELTGVADPEEIRRTLQEPGLAGRVRHHFTVTMLDAENVLEFNSRFSADKELVRTLRKQIESADLVAVNKQDLAAQGTMDKIESMIRKHNPEAAIVYTEYSRIDLSSLLDGVDRRQGSKAAAVRAGAQTPAQEVLSSKAQHRFGGAVDPAASHTHRLAHNGHGAGSTATVHAHEGHGGHGGHEHLDEAVSFSKVSTVTLTFPPAEQSPASLSRERLEAFFRECGDALLRAKGHVALARHEPVQLVQYAGTHTFWETSRYPGAPYLVMIGLNLNEARLKERWSELFR
ncbi:G3E family GTPase [Paenibacillus favisporus]|uniref:G3E family GTPase n=1 Tax=Paenibacillus favisporus TaxID=221028 RepID=A0ABV2FAD7_9BACL